jgi:hypothetical protein
MGILLVIVLAMAAGGQPDAPETPQEWRDAEQAWRESFQAAHKDYQPPTPELAPEVPLTPLPPSQPRTRRQYTIIPTSKGFQVLRIDKKGIAWVDRPWDSRRAAEYAVHDLAQRDRFESDAVPAGNHPARFARQRIGNQHPNRRAVTPQD